MVVEGLGSYGIVISNPRIPLINETFDEIKKYDEVSKILLDKIIETDLKYYKPAKIKYFEEEFTLLKKIVLEFPTIFKKKFYMLPKNGGIINKEEIKKKINKNCKFEEKWLTDKKNNYIRFISLLLEYDSTNIYQVIYDRGNKINYNLSDFLKKIINVKDALLLANFNKFFFDDIKLENLIEHEDTIKIIDFSYIINLNLDFNEIIEIIENSKLDSLFYFPYNIVSNILIYEYIDRLDDIGELLNNFDYQSILFSNSLEEKDNIIYKKYIFDNLLEICTYYIPDYILNLRVRDPTKNSNEIIYEIKSFTIKEFVKSLHKMIIFYEDDYKEFYKNKNDINTMFMEYKRFLNDFSNKDKLLYLLKQLNLYSFGFILVNWLYKNRNKFLYKSKKKDNINLIDIENNLKQMIDIISICCSNPIFINDSVFFTDYNFTDITNYFTP